MYVKKRVSTEFTSGSSTLCLINVVLSRNYFAVQLIFSKASM